MSGFSSPTSFGSGNRIIRPGGETWSGGDGNSSYNGGEGSSQPDSPLSPLFRSSPRGQSDSPDFIPLGSSSPSFNNSGLSLRFRGGSRGRTKWTHQQRMSSGGIISFNNNSGLNTDLSAGFSPYQPNRSNSFSPRRRFQRRGGGSMGGGHHLIADVTLYYQHSMIEDPWAPLEHKLALNATRAAMNIARSFSDSDDLERGRGASASDESEAEPASSDTA